MTPLQNTKIVHAAETKTRLLKMLETHENRDTRKSCYIENYISPKFTNSSTL